MIVDGFVPKSPLKSFSPSSNVATYKSISPIPNTILNSQLHESAPRTGFRSRVKSVWQRVIPKGKNNNHKVQLSKRRILFGAAAFVVSMFARPVTTLAMGAMGGSKGPVAPMSR